MMLPTTGAVFRPDVAPMPGFTLQRELVALNRIGVPPSPLQDVFLAVLADAARQHGLIGSDLAAQMGAWTCA